MKSVLFYAAAVITGIALVVFMIVLVRSLWYVPEETHAPMQGPNVSTSPEVAVPLRLIIPKLSINAQVQKTGINATGAMGVPTNFTDVAWYQYGTVPGEKGSAVLDGHVDNGLGLDGVFKHLGDITVGDEIDIETNNGNILRFIVSNVELYPYTEVPNDLIFNRNDRARLNLITCEGAWVKGERTYDHRLVVFATLI